MHVASLQPKDWVGRRACSRKCQNPEGDEEAAVQAQGPFSSCPPVLLAAGSHPSEQRTQPSPALSPLQDHAGLAELVGEGSCYDDWDTREFTGPWGGPPCPTQGVRATSSKWDQFLLTPGNSSHVDTEPLTPLQRGPRPDRGAQAEQTPRKRGLSRTPGVLQLSQATHTPTAEPKRPFGGTSKHIWGTGPQAEGGPLVKQAQEPRPMRLGDLFNTGEDFDDDL